MRWTFMKIVEYTAKVLVIALVAAGVGAFVAANMRPVQVGLTDEQNAALKKMSEAQVEMAKAQEAIKIDVAKTLLSQANAQTVVNDILKIVKDLQNRPSQSLTAMLPQGTGSVATLDAAQMEELKRYFQESRGISNDQIDVLISRIKTEILLPLQAGGTGNTQTLTVLMNQVITTLNQHVAPPTPPPAPPTPDPAPQPTPTAQVPPGPQATNLPPTPPPAPQVQPPQPRTPPRPQGLRTRPPVQHEEATPAPRGQDSNRSASTGRMTEEEALRLSRR